MQPHTRPPKLTPEQAARLDAEGEVDVTLKKAPWYYPLMEQSTKVLLAACAGMALFIFNQYNETQKDQASATTHLANVMGSVQQELVKQGAQLVALTDTMRQLSMRQDAAIATAERAMAEQQGLRSRVELLQYYVLEFDGKLIAAGIVLPKDSVALKLRKQQEDDKQ